MRSAERCLIITDSPEDFRRYSNSVRSSLHSFEEHLLAVCLLVEVIAPSTAAR